MLEAVEEPPVLEPREPLGCDRICHTHAPSWASSLPRSRWRPAMVTAVVAESRYDPRADEVEALDSRLTELARSGAPLRRALARIAGAFDERRAWEPLGYARPGLRARASGCPLASFATRTWTRRSPRVPAGRGGLCRVAARDERLWLRAGGSRRRPSRAVQAIDGVARGLHWIRRATSRGRECSGAHGAAREIKWGNVERTLRRVVGGWLPGPVSAGRGRVLSDGSVGPALPPLARRVHSGMPGQAVAGPAPPDVLAQSRPSSRRSSPV
jgi:hypothetical protein